MNWTDLKDIEQKIVKNDIQTPKHLTISYAQQSSTPLGVF